MTAQLIEKLQNPDLYPHTIEKFEIVETHISWVILTGEYAYKIKKAVDFGFLDFSSLAKRKFYCEEELRLNRRLASDIYLEVVTITDSHEHPQINGSGPIIEYALKMKQFPQKNIFNHLWHKNRLTLAYVEQTTRLLAQFHQHISREAPNHLGTAEQVHEPVIQNFDQIRPLLTDPMELEKIAHLEAWSNEQHQKWLEVFKDRKQTGFIRECHGDVHLGNIVLIDKKPRLFDCLEFNESLRWTDTMADVGFLIMDLCDHNLFTFARQAINTYLAETGDYAGLQVLPYYIVYRAMVRAKVHLFDLHYMPSSTDKKKQLLHKYQHYIALAEYFTKESKPFMLLTHGYSGSGKSSIAHMLVKELGCIQIRSDLERKRLAGLEPHAQTFSGLYENIYHPDMTQRTYQSLLNLARTIISAGFNVIVDAAFLKNEQRQIFIALAQQMEIPLAILHCDAAAELLKTRLQKRKTNKVSEATERELIAQQRDVEPLTDEEKPYTVQINTSTAFAIQHLINALSPIIGKREVTAQGIS